MFGFEPLFRTLPILSLEPLEVLANVSEIMKIDDTRDSKPDLLLEKCLS